MIYVQTKSLQKNDLTNSSWPQVIIIRIAEFSQYKILANEMKNWTEKCFLRLSVWQNSQLLLKRACIYFSHQILFIITWKYDQCHRGYENYVLNLLFSHFIHTCCMYTFEKLLFWLYCADSYSIIIFWKEGKYWNGPKSEYSNDPYSRSLKKKEEKQKKKKSATHGYTFIFGFIFKTDFSFLWVIVSRRRKKKEAKFSQCFRV